MNKLPAAYTYFLAALKNEKQREGSGFQNNLALTLEKSEAYISKIINNKSVASFNLQNEVAEACGYSYIEFLQLGKRLVKGESSACFNKSIPGIEESPSEIQPKPPIGNVIRVYNTILEKTGIQLDAEGQEKLFNLIKKKLHEKTVEAAEQDFVEILSLSHTGKKE